ncbi:MAG: hypothetical protein WAO58_13080 [Fimbriimonadaceae bacterium]
MVKKSLFLGVMSLALLAAAGQDGVTLAWKPAVGSVSKYRLTSTSNMQGMSAEFGATMTMKVESVTGDKVKTSATTSEMTLKVGDQDMSAMMASMVSTVTTVVSLSGEVLERTLTAGQSEFDSPKLESAFTMIFPSKPVKVGDTWVREVKAGSKTGFSASKSVFTYLGTEKIADKYNTHKIKFEFKELDGSTPMTGSGTVWIQAEDGALMKQEFSLKNAEVSPGMVADMTGKMIRISFEPGK